MAISQAESEFMARMRHDLRTPLNAILGFGQLLAMDDLTPSQQEAVAQIIKGGHELLNLINARAAPEQSGLGQDAIVDYQP
jgi:signal transduction histidine kinase